MRSAKLAGACAVKLGATAAPPRGHQCGAAGSGGAAGEVSGDRWNDGPFLSGHLCIRIVMP